MAAAARVSVELLREAFAVFERLLLLDRPTREHELEALERSRPDLYPHLVTLLDADQAAQSENFLGADALKDGAGPAPRLASGTVIGPYRLEQPVGVGGMGEVWRAARTDGLSDAPVAVKVLHAHLASGVARGRFVHEGRFLSRLSHPHVAHLLDAGVTPAGLRYLVIEFVEGSRLDRWCDERRLSIDARLHLFLQICDAVAHAHAHLVVHRDLKPSNVLVTSEGATKLLDFGIAKLVDPEQSGEGVTDLTRQGDRALTPEYAAPEQISKGAITTATDVYALGVVLFGLLCGRRPYGAEPLSPAQLEQTILQVEPPHMSRALAGAQAEELAASRGSSVARLQRELRGDLDNIVARALQKKPSDRYLSVPALAGDLRRYLNHEPVLAQPESFAYRARKFVRRHRVGVAAGVAVALALALGLAGALWQAREARLQRDVALSEASRNEGVRQALLQLFRSAGEQRGAETMTARQVFDAAAERVLQDYRDEPDTAAGVLLTLGQLHEALNDDVAAEPLFERVIAAQPADAGVLTEARWKLATIRLRQGRYDEAREMLAEVAVFFGRDPPRYRNGILALRREQARLAGMTGDHAGERATLEATIAENLVQPTSDPTELALLHDLLATAHYRANDVAGAYAVQEKGLELWQKAGAGQHNDALIAKNNQATNALRLGRVAEAERRFRAVIAERRELFGESAMLAGSLNNYGAALALLDRHDEAMAVLGEALPMAVREAGENQIVTLNARLQIARTHLFAGRPRPAVEVLTPALAAADASFGTHHPFAGALRHTLGAAYLALGDFMQADALISQAVTNLREAGASGSYFLARALVDLGRLRQVQDRGRDAVAAAEESVRLRESLLPAESWELAEAQAELGAALRKLGEGERGLTLQRQAVATLRAQLGEGHSFTRRYAEALNAAR